MTQIPEGTQFIGISPDVSLVQKRSQLINDESAGYTAFQIAQAAGLATVTDVTYDELVALIDASSLVVGGVYRITDFQTLHEIPNTTERNDTNVEIPIEVLVCIASSTNTLFRQVQSEDYPDDIIHYTVDNTAWKDLQIDGQKGCITLRIDTLLNIEVGNGDWRNFIVRRWAADLTAFGDGAIRWVLWASSTNCGITNTGATQTFTALDTNVYNATTNPDGYKDVRLFTSSNNPWNVVIKSEAYSNHFPMPNMYVEITGTSWSGTNMGNVNLSVCENCTFTDRLDNTTGQFFTTICTRVFSFQQYSVGYFSNVFLAKASSFGYEIRENWVNVTFFLQNEQSGKNYGVFKNLNNVHVEFLAGATSFNQWSYVTLENIYYIRAKIQGARPMMFKINDIGFTGVVNAGGSTERFKDISVQTSNVIYNPAAQSTIETTAAAAAAITLSSATSSTVLDMFAGIINLTGSGTVDIDTLTRFLPNNFPVILKPASGLTISIDQNNVADGFVNSGTITANGTNGEVIILTPIGDRWKAS